MICKEKSDLSARSNTMEKRGGTVFVTVIEDDKGTAFTTVVDV